MHILVSNDDGYLSPGIRALASAMHEFGEVSVFAPEIDKSGSSNSLTLDRPLRVKKSDLGFYYINGTPTDCVHLATTTILKTPPDLVVTGINCGRNMAEDIYYSGTVAAAMEGFMMGIPSIAYSLNSINFQNLQTAVKVAKQITSKWISLSPQPPFLFNVNIPDVPFDKLEGIEICRPGKRAGAMKAQETKSPKGDLFYWVGPVGKPIDDDQIGTDFYALKNNRASITPLKTNMHDESYTDEIRNWFETKS